MQFTPPPPSLLHVDYNLLTSKLLCAGAGNGNGPGIQVFIMYKEYFKKEKKKTVLGGLLCVHNDV